ncbi:MAG: hypothetical protein ABJF50_13760 [Paracoccaceae bacterium]
MIEIVTDIRNFWHPLAIIVLLGYFILSFARFWQRTKDAYENLYGTENYLSNIMPPSPRNDGTPQDEAFQAVYYPAMRQMWCRVALTWAAIIALAMIY